MTEDDKARAATIFDVARLAGVSHQTVSRVLNDLPNVRPATRQRVENAIRQLRYVPSPAARAMVTRRSRTIGLITTGSADFGPSSTALHFNETARDARYAVITAGLLEADAAHVRSAAELLVRQNVEAIVLIVQERAAVEGITGVDLGVPVVAVSSEDRGAPHRVALDQYAGARAAVDHLVGLGHRDIRHIAGPAGSMDAAERMRGWFGGLAAHGLVSREPLIGDWTPASGYAHGVRLASEGSATAVFVANDQMALGLIRAYTEAGLRVPDDLSVVGFDDIPEAAFFSPPLTTVRQDFTVLGRAAMEAVLGVLGEREGGAPEALAAAGLGVSLVVRSSSAAPAAAPPPAAGASPAQASEISSTVSPVSAAERERATSA
ncbi:LacI family DNA-binding transcriptional regulator [Herbiconiux sp. KACC 21604]|uniref:LacI family DNA-binding transcriptional regulator n=1 Tax=unclassified Herbiconiux TaxID=2618217 RepID=UPI001490A1DD|nr:LacI family DNA-binding transcriptional regulator [Herbiconiux sp. SALV-R1]QJU52587.1 LacI family DNA-binding transcriptional regulator [Herbiconiux sp. SALV-R1]WPO87473.1 LacI family DNA-binding transcriptional regulator [Herbiconiux sp. KACC 21604]